MNRLKIILQFDSSKFVHLAIVATLFTLTNTSYLAIFLLICELVYLIKVSKNLAIYSFIIIAVLFIRTGIINNTSNVSEGVVVNVEQNRITIKNINLYYLYLDNPEDYEIGMKVRFTGDEINGDYKNIPGGFDYKTYLLSKNIKMQIDVLSIEIVGEEFTLEKIPKYLNTYITDKYDYKVSTYLKLFILGENEGLDQIIANKSRLIGISHLFAISGMHLSLIIGFITFLLNHYYLKRRTHQLIIGGFLLVYNIITGFSISIIRASLLTVCLFFDVNRTFTRVDYLSFIMVGLLMFNPYNIYNIGFVLSFLISFSIMLGKFLWNDDKKIIQVLKIGVLANLISLPIIISLNGSYGLINIFYNVFFVYFVSFLFLPFSFIILFIPGLESFYFVIIESFEQLVELSFTMNYFLDFKFSTEVIKLLYWIGLLGCLVNYQNNKRKIYFLLTCVVIIVSVSGYKINDPTFVRLLDVNQADAIHLHDQSCDILIDTGDVDDYNTVIDYFVNQNIKKIDYLIITHLHQDHYGEAIDILEELEVKNLIINQQFSDFDKYKGIVLREGETLSCGSFQLLNINEFNSQNENNNSLVFYTRIMGDRWLFTGDIEKVVEESLLEKYNLDINILKVPHHGSITSSTEEFIKKIDPEYGLISVGKNNYSHPHNDILERLEMNNTKVFRTDIVGTITFYYYPVIKVSLIETYLLGEKRKYTIKNFSVYAQTP